LVAGCGSDAVTNLGGTASNTQFVQDVITTWKLNYPNNPRSDPDELVLAETCSISAERG